MALPSLWHDDDPSGRLLPARGRRRHDAAVQLRPTEPLRKHSAGLKRPEPTKVLPYKEPKEDVSLPF